MHTPAELPSELTARTCANSTAIDWARHEFGIDANNIVKISDQEEYDCQRTLLKNQQFVNANVQRRHLELIHAGLKVIDHHGGW